MVLKQRSAWSRVGFARREINLMTFKTGCARKEHCLALLASVSAASLLLSMGAAQAQTITVGGTTAAGLIYNDANGQLRSGPLGNHSPITDITANNVDAAGNPSSATLGTDVTGSGVAGFSATYTDKTAGVSYNSTLFGAGLLASDTNGNATFLGSTGVAMIDAAGNTSIVSAAGGLVTFNNTHLAAYTASGALVTDGANVTVVGASGTGTLGTASNGNAQVILSGNGVQSLTQISHGSTATGMGIFTADLNASNAVSITPDQGVQVGVKFLRAQQ